MSHSRLAVVRTVRAYGGTVLAWKTSTLFVRSRVKSHAVSTKKITTKLQSHPFSLNVERREDKRTCFFLY